MKRLSRFRFTFFILTLICILGFSLRFYQLGEIPLGLNNDEASIGYNAFSILETGKDQYGEIYPVYFESYGDQKMPLYIYATSQAIKMFGLNEFAVRFTSALFGFLTVLGVFFLTKSLIQRNDIALTASFLISINPWHVFFSRAGFEVNVATAFLTFGILSFVLGIKQKKYMYVFGFISLLCFVLSMYTYNATRILAPVLFLSLFVFYRREIGAHFFVKTVSFLLIFILCAIPLVVSSNPETEVSTQESLFIFSGETYGKYIEFRGFLVSLPFVVSKVFFNTPFLIAWQYLKNIASFFSVDFFFINGTSHPINGVTNHGMFYLFEILTIPVGIFLIIRGRVRSFYFFLYWIVVTVLLASITREIPHPTRVYAIVIPLTIVSAYGAVFLIRRTVKIQLPFIRNLAVAAVFALCFFSIMYFIASYFVYFPIQYAKTWRAVDRELSEYLLSIEPSYERILINKDSEFLYTSLLFYGAYSPQRVQNEAQYREDGLLKTMEKIGKFEFREIDWGKDLNLSNTVIVSTKDVPQDGRLLKIFYYPTKPVVIYHDGITEKLDVKDTAYGIFKAN